MEVAGFSAWLVDLDGTLYRQRPVRLAMAAELALMGPHRIRIVKRFRREQERLRKEPQPAGDACPYQAQLAGTARALALPIEHVAKIVQHWMERRPCKWLRLFRRAPLIAEIAAFRQRGGKTALVSDYPASVKLAGMGIANLFDVVVACGEPEGPPCLKPSPLGYLLAAERLAIPAERCLVIGDRPDADGAAAERAGMAFRLVA
jgi:FMN phosphatase YigB (HAD superfamily)